MVPQAIVAKNRDDQSQTTTKKPDRFMITLGNLYQISQIVST